MRWWCITPLFASLIAAEAQSTSSLETPENALEFIHLDYVSNHKSKQNKLRQLIIRQDRTEDKIIRTRRQNKKSYNRIYLQHVRKLQREMQNLKDWRNKQSDVSTETLADYETKFKNLEDRIAKQGDLITRLVYGYKGRSRRPRRRRVNNAHMPLVRGRRSVDNEPEDTVARMDRLEDMFHLVIQKKDSEIQGFKKTVNEMKLKIADLEFSLENANDRFEGVQLETTRLLETEMIMNETIAELEARLYDAEVKVKVGGHQVSSSSSSDYDDEAVVVPAVGAPKLTPDYPSSSSSSSSIGKSSPEHQELEAEIQFLYDKIAQMENDMNVTTATVSEHAETAKVLAEQAFTKLETLQGQVVYNTELNQMSASNKEELHKVSNKLQQHSLQMSKLWKMRKDILSKSSVLLKKLSKMRNGFDPTTPGAEHSKLDPATFVKKADIEPALKLLNETVSESLAVVDDVRDFHHSQITNLDAKVDENEDSLLYINSTLDNAVGKLDDLGVHMNGFAQALERFSDLYHKLEGEMNIFKVNATANMASFDRTVDLSIDLLDRMGQFNEDIVNRVSRLEETAYYSDEADASSDYEESFFGDEYEDEASDSDIEETEDYDDLPLVAE